LKSIRSRFKNDPNINFSNVKFRYELEIPEKYVKGKKKPKEFEYTSQRKGYQRFLTQEIKDVVDELEDAEEDLRQAMLPFICSLFNRFHSKNTIWNRAVC
jgi:DNA mismatch repair protein MSH6